MFSVIFLMAAAAPVTAANCGVTAATASTGLVSSTEGGVTVYRPPSTFIADPCVSPSLEGLPKIASTANHAWEVQRTGNIPVSAAPDIVGAFRFICQPGQVNWDDSIVYPGMIGASPHLHQWFGNTLANGQSTYKSLRTSGESTCMGPMNRSAYWQPAMMNKLGQVVRPDLISIYYKRLPKSNAKCGAGGKYCIALPRGMRYIFGYDMKRMHEAQPENQQFIWKCLTPQQNYRGELQQRFDTLDCPAGHTLIVTISSPDCWDGKFLDSADHRSHIVFEKRDPHTGQMACPASHPYILPTFTIGAWYSVMAGENVSDWHLSSDRMKGMPAMPSGSSFHADWYGAWDDDVLKAWTDNCINKLLNCSAGELGDGTIMRRPLDYSLVAKPRIVAAPTRPAVAMASLPRRRQVKPSSVRLALPGDVPSVKPTGTSQVRRDGPPQPKHISVPPERPASIAKTQMDSAHQMHR